MARGPTCSRVVITGLEQGGQLTTTTDVDNWPGDVRRSAGSRPDAAHAGTRRAFRYRNRVRSHSHRGPRRSARFAWKGTAGVYTADALVIATGASAKYLGLPSEEAFKGKGVSACATCDGFFYRGRKVAVIGGGNTAVEEALYLSNIAAEVVLVHRRDELRAEKILQDRLFDREQQRQRDDSLGSRARRSAGRRQRRDRHARAQRALPRRKPRSNWPACSSPSVMRPTPAFSKASWT